MIVVAVVGAVVALTLAAVLFDAALSQPITRRDPQGDGIPPIG